MLTLKLLLDDERLGLRRVAGGDADPEIRWAHVSELPDPVPWLRGGEFLLTTGLELFRDEGGARVYVASLMKRGVGALGLSTGATLPHARIPDDLVEAADALGFPLVHIPELTPLQAVVRAVSDALNLEETEPLRRALLAQRRLSEAATKSDALAAVLDTLSAGTGISATIHDLSLRPLARSGDLAAEASARYEAEMADRIVRGGQWSFADESQEATTLAYPIGVEGRARGLLLATKVGRMDLFDRTLVSMVVSLLSVLLELRHSAGVQRRDATQRIVGRLVDGGLTDIDAALQLASIGVQCSVVQALVLPAALTEDVINVVGAHLQRHAAHVLVHHRAGSIVLLLCDPDSAADQAVVALADRVSLGPAGVGMRVDPAQARISVDQAVRACTRAAAKGEPVGVLALSPGYRALLAIGSPSERAAFADATLAPLDAHDARYRSDLGRTLQAYFDHTLNIDRAAKQLSIHRHTMRTRLDRISTLTGHDLNDSAALLELWLACETRLLSLPS